MNSNDPFQLALIERRKKKESSEKIEDPSTFGLISGAKQTDNSKQVQQDPFAMAADKRKVNQENKEEEDLWGSIKRFGARSLSSLQANVAAIPSLAENLSKSIAETMGVKSDLLLSKEKKFKTAQEFKELNKNLFGKELLEPRNDWEKKLDEVTDDFILGSLPIFGGPIRFARPLLSSIAGNAAKSATEFMGSDESTSSKAKIGAMIASYMINPGAAKQLESRLYNQQTRALPRDANIDAPHLRTHINQFRRVLEQGGTAPSKSGALTKLDEIEAAFQGGRIPVRELTEFKKSINELIADRYSAIGVSKEGSASTLHNLNRIATAIDRTISRYGRRNPAWHNIYRQANEVHSALSRGEQIRRWLDGQRKGALKNAGLAHALGHGISAPVAASALAADLSIRAGTILSKIGRSPTLTRHYLQFLDAAARRNLPIVNKELENLDYFLKKEDQ